MSLQELLDGYAAIYRLQGLALDANDMCRLSFGEGVDVDLEPSHRPTHIHIYAVLGRAPQDPATSYYRALLEGNLYGRDTGAAAVGCDPATDEILLWQLVSLEGMTPAAFDLLLQDFVAAALRVRARMAEQAVQPVVDNDEGDPTVFLRTMQIRV